MKFLLILSLFSTIAYSEDKCPLVKFKGFTTKDLTDTDYLCYKKAQVRCGELYPKSPCLKVFQKTGELAYRAICGAAK